MWRCRDSNIRFDSDSVRSHISCVAHGRVQYEIHRHNVVHYKILTSAIPAFVVVFLYYCFPYDLREIYLIYRSRGVQTLYGRDVITIYVANLLLFDDIFTFNGNNVLRESANRGRIYHKESLKVACAVCQRQRRSKRSVFVLMPIYRSRVDGKCSAVCPCRVDKQFVM